MTLAIFELFARLPMAWFHRAGKVFGWLMYVFSQSDASRLRDNLRAAGVFSNEQEYRELLREAIAQTGNTAAEWVKVWFAPHGEIDRLVNECHGWSLVDEARNSGKGVIILMPHLGSFQVAMRYIAQRLPLTALHRPPRQRWLKPIVMAGSKRSQLALAPTNLKGVEALMRALRRGEAVVVPPDQAPNSRGGVWADFFGRPAYTTTLPRKLQRATGAVILTAFAERLPRGKGFCLVIDAMPTDNLDETELNRVIERLVRRCPGQFLWSYNRYKIPRKARGMEQETQA
jgi:KDO2-lipid IV(A) lauroyltransferase